MLENKVRFQELENVYATCRYKIQHYFSCLAHLSLDTPTYGNTICPNLTGIDLGQVEAGEKVTIALFTISLFSYKQIFSFE